MHEVTTDSRELTRFIDDLNDEYERLHTAKEDAFWTVHMGLAPDRERAQAKLDRLEIELSGFLRDPERLARVRRELQRARSRSEGGAAGDRPSAEDLTCLEGWTATLEAHVIESSRARGWADEIVVAEGALARARGQMRLTYEASPGRPVEASSVKLGVLLASDPDARVRRSAWEGLCKIELHVLQHGFLDLVRRRNQLGRELSGDDYYDWKVRRVERMTKVEVFDLLDELERATRASGERALRELERIHGKDEVRPWNIRFLVSGDITREQDPYFPFSKALERWVRSFAGLGIGYRGAELVLDLVDRPGKYENGFMHGPVPAWRQRGVFRPARIQFTANAIPGMVGAGRRACETLFHEGGHAAHFANIDMPSPCFAQEFAPTSVAFAETQSMFCDSLLSDADWQVRYARRADGGVMPLALIEKGLRQVQPFAAWNLRAMLSVCYAERAIYEIPDAELSLERVLAEIRAVEKRLLFLDEGSPRPTLSVPHLLSGDSSAYYHGYVLAEMAVEQTRAYFLARDGHLVDNPRIGDDLCQRYWRPGNSKTFREYIADLTGRPLGASALAARVSRTADEALAQAQASVERASALAAPAPDGGLDCRLRIVDGEREIASLGTDGLRRVERMFEAWIDERARSFTG